MNDTTEPDPRAIQVREPRAFVAKLKSLLAQGRIDETAAFVLECQRLLKSNRRREYRRLIFNVG